MLAGETPTQVAVSGHRDQIRIQQVLVPYFKGAVVVDPHLQQSVVLLLHPHDAWREGLGLDHQCDSDDVKVRVGNLATPGDVGWLLKVLHWEKSNPSLQSSF